METKMIHETQFKQLHCLCVFGKKKERKEKKIEQKLAHNAEKTEGARTFSSFILSLYEQLLEW